MVSRTKINGYDLKGAGKLVEVDIVKGEFVFEDEKTGKNSITFAEIAQLVGREVAFTLKITEKELV